PPGHCPATLLGPMTAAEDRAPAPIRDGLRPLIIGNEWLTTQAGGLNRYLADLIGALGAAGADVRAIVVGCPPPNGPVVGAVSADASLATRLVAMRAASTRLATSADVVDAHFALYAGLAIFTTRLRRCPLIVHFQGPWADESLFSRGGSWAIPVKR